VINKRLGKWHKEGTRRRRYADAKRAQILALAGHTVLHLMDDVYRPHDIEEGANLLTPEVAATLNPDERYGVWWYNRQRVKWSEVSEAGPQGRIYCRRAHTPSRTSAIGSRFRCPTPGYAARARDERASDGLHQGDKGYVFYCRCPRAYGYDGESSHRKNQRDDKWELAIWKLVSGLLKEPERIREDLEQAEKNVLEAVDEVAQRLGNTRDIARES
jgi:hypothetical protein